MKRKREREIDWLIDSFKIDLRFFFFKYIVLQYGDSDNQTATIKQPQSKPNRQISIKHVDRYGIV
jgi:hypothetical protein